MPIISVGYRQATFVSLAQGGTHGPLPSSGLGARREAPGRAKISARPDRSQRERLSRAGFTPCARAFHSPISKRDFRRCKPRRWHVQGAAQIRRGRVLRRNDRRRAEIFALPGASRLTICLASQAALHGLAVTVLPTTAGRSESSQT